MRELQAGLWHWQAPHPDWTPSERWPREVSSYAIDDGARLLLFDPLAVPDELLELAADREPVVVLTAPWHERDAQSLVERLGVPVYTPLPDTAKDLMQKYGITAEQAGDGSPDLVWLLRENKGEARTYTPATGSRLEQTCSRGRSRTTPSSGSKATVRLFPETRSSTSVTASRSTPGFAGA